ncbi:hypothetical protein [Actinopolymorpha pittospori]|uniref:Uncharacterized protein n=1 Tax=Actinopolymorpha pittospori TaxID=648752 RepID=A0A927MZP4_9ACTN|nr:hypothetical protein [Actinopolymorpha pittospori]MBE1609935.1 hypothetical protein [Actinopolymorpha pittospori]
MSGYEETNVRIPPCAFDALATVAARRGASRDETVRQLLNAHIERQERWEADDRLTHISTVLRYPRPPRWRGDQRTDKPLRLRLAPGQMLRARAVSLKLPGQRQRAHHDYPARLLTDAVMTAIAMEEDFTDEFLEGLLPVLRHSSALGLWQLAVAATITTPEHLVYQGAEDWYGRRLTPEAPRFSRHALLVAEALDDEVAWHSPVRFQVATNIARHKLTGANAEANEQMLYEQQAEWHALRQRLRKPGPERAQYLRTTTSYDWTGRGGTAVWRAERRVAVQDLEEWLVKGDPGGSVERVVSPPEWSVQVPGAWRALTFPTMPTPQPYATWAAEGRVLTFPYNNKQAVWPLTARQGRHGWEPVPDIEPIISPARKLRSDQIVGFIEAVLINWNDGDEDSVSHHRLHLPVDKAFDFGLITAEEQREARAQARTATLRTMDEIIDKLTEHERHLRPGLERAKGDARRFGRLAKEAGVRFRITRAMWPWPGRSVVDELSAGTRPALLDFLADWAYRNSQLVLEQSMEAAWDQAFDRYGRRG